MDNGRVVGENVILTGFMGTGKTTAGRLLAEKLSREFIDTDAMIAGRAGQPIAEIFSEQGEARFRRLERELAAELAGQRDLVIATGGRMMLDPGSAALLGATGPVFSLSAEPDHLVTRLANDGDPRPQIIAESADLECIVCIGERGGPRHLRAGAGSGRHANDRRDRARYEVVAEVVVRPAAVG